MPPQKLVDPSQFIHRIQVFRKNLSPTFFEDQYQSILVFYGKLETVKIMIDEYQGYVSEIGVMRIISWYEILNRMQRADKVLIGLERYFVMERAVQFAPPNNLFGYIKISENLE